MKTHCHILTIILDFIEARDDLEGCLFKSERGASTREGSLLVGEALVLSTVIGSDVGMEDVTDPLEITSSS